VLGAVVVPNIPAESWIVSIATVNIPVVPKLNMYERHSVTFVWHLQAFHLTFSAISKKFVCPLPPFPLLHPLTYKKTRSSTTSHGCVGTSGPISAECSHLGSSISSNMDSSVAGVRAVETCIQAEIGNTCLAPEIELTRKCCLLKRAEIPFFLHKNSSSWVPCSGAMGVHMVLWARWWVCPGVRAQNVLDSGAGRDVTSISY
jgi:hypothetical protein